MYGSVKILKVTLDRSGDDSDEVMRTFCLHLFTYLGIFCRYSLLLLEFAGKLISQFSLWWFCLNLKLAIMPSLKTSQSELQ
jgi:hypothetical protein